MHLSSMGALDAPTQRKERLGRRVKPADGEKESLRQGPPPAPAIAWLIGATT
jgi:hypothetical protein